MDALAQDNKELVRRLLEDAIGGGDRAALGDVLAEEFRWHGAGAEDVEGAQAFADLLAPFAAAFPDMTVTVHELVAEGDRVVARFTTAGTHRGEVMGVPATGRRVAWDGTNVYRIAGGRVAEEWSCEDNLTLLRTIGGLGGAGDG